MASPNYAAMEAFLPLVEKHRAEIESIQSKTFQYGPTERQKVHLRIRDSTINSDPRSLRSSMSTIPQRNRFPLVGRSLCFTSSMEEGLSMGIAGWLRRTTSPTPALVHTSQSEGTYGIQQPGLYSQYLKHRKLTHP